MNKVEEITDKTLLLERFLRRGKEIDGVRYQTAYVQANGHAFALMDIKGRILGGYVMITRGSFRVLELAKSLSPIIADRADYYQEQKAIELGGLWLEPSVKTYGDSDLLWRHIGRTVRASGCSHIIYGFHSGRPGIKRMYRQLSGDILFQGATTDLDHLKTHSHLTLQVVSYSKACLFYRILRIKRWIFRYKRRGHAKLYNALQDATIGVSSSVESLR